ncbi:hypothetical protein PP757_gp74 [Pseudomonas phage vB_PaeP_TUMS_P121]|uniref:Uncharacterized protein n=1 Tax=Pseudomonas phage vB_PaeP_TUMS_P121 TaxID=2873372 RepID=A0AAE8YHK9_9CAUD|nr:hypothetical protein PP757_gp74 [Pseudomonas phage vB_PaeP_TUMS_P121]UEP18706.1 hypothetical protein [Pseudomonas phage vB_PaeP_TUMS_P121]UGL61033.1 hypothetical protein [Pseudomonas phage vB_PaeS_TUMS_P81]
MAQLKIRANGQYTVVDMVSTEWSLSKKFTTFQIVGALRQGDSYLYIFDGLTEEVTRKGMTNVADGLMMSRLRSYVGPFNQLFVKYQGSWFVFSNDFTPVTDKLVPKEIIAQSLLFD